MIYKINLKNLKFKTLLNGRTEFEEIQG